MKYCNNCGNKLQDNQKFCDKCGKSVSYNNLNSSYNSGTPQPPKKNGGKIVMIIITIIVFLLLLAGLLFGAYKLFWENDTSSNGTNNSSINGNDTQGDDSQNNEDVDGAPTIDVLTDTFNTTFMNQDNRSGYGFIRIGMNKDEVENKFGQPNDSVIIAGTSASQYGSIAVHYNHDIVERYFIVPSNDITVYQFINQHGDPTMKADEGGIVYDDNADNDFTVKVFVDENSKVEGIESVEQIERTDSSDESDSNEIITSKSKAEKIGKDYLFEKYDDDYWFHSVDEYNGIYRVNYGEGDASHAHDAIYIDQETGNITESDPNEEN